MAFPYLYAGGCAAIGSLAWFVASRLYERNGLQEAAIQQVTVTNTTGTGVLGRDLGVDDPLLQPESLEKAINEVKAKLADLQTRYHEKHGVNLTDLAAAKGTSGKSTSVIKSKARKKGSKSSNSSSEGTGKVATVIHKLDQKGTAQTCNKFGRGNTAAILTTAEAENSPSTCFSEDEKSMQIDPLVGKPGVEPNEKVEKWLKTNTEILPQSHSARNEKNVIRPKPVAMTISAWDSPRSKKSLDRDTVDTCETYVASPKRESLKKNAPHLYKRLMLRKKSTVALEEPKPSKLKSRKLEEGHNDTPRKHKEKSNKTDSSKKSFKSEPDLRTGDGKREQAVRAVTNKSVANLLANQDTDEDTSVEYANEKYDGSDSDHYIGPRSGSSDECGSNVTYNKSVKGKFGSVPQSRKISSPSLAKSQPKSAGNLAAVEAAPRQSSCPKLKQSQTRLKKKIDEVLGMKSKSFDKRRSSPDGSKRSQSPSKPQRSSVSGCGSGSESESEAMWVSKPKTSGAPRESRPKTTRTCAPNSRRPSPQQRRAASDGPDSAEEVDVGAKAKRADKKKAFAAKNDAKFSGSSQERPAKCGTETLSMNTNLSDKKKEVHDKNHENVSGSTARANTSAHDMLPAKKLHTKSKDFLTKYQLRGPPCLEGPQSAEKEDLPSIVNPFDKRKEFQAKYHLKENSGVDGQQSETKNSSSAKANPFEKRKEFEAKYHIRDFQHEDGCRSPPEKAVPSLKANSFDKRKEFQSKYHMKGSSAVRENPEPVDTQALVVQARSEKRKEALAQYQKKYVPGRSRSHETEELTSKMKTETRGKVLGEGSSPSGRSSPEKEVASVKPGKISPLQRRMEYDAKCRMKSSSNLHKRNSSANEGLREKASPFDDTDDNDSPFRAQETDCSPAPAERVTSPSAKSESVRRGRPPTMNRQPNDATRKAFLFDWESKQYAVANKPDVAVAVPRGGELKKPRGSSIPPPTSKNHPPSMDMKRPMSAGVKKEGTRPSSAKPRRRKFGIDPEDEDSSADERSLAAKRSSDWGSKPSNNSLDFEFDAKGLRDSNFSSAANSVVSEEDMVKELENNGEDFKSMGPSSGNVSEEDAERETDINDMTGEFVFPKCTSDLIPNEYNVRPKLQDILDLPIDCSASTINANLLSRSETRIGSDDEGTPSDHVFTGAKALRTTKKRSVFHKGSSEVISVLTEGYRQLAVEEILNDPSTRNY